MEHHFLVFQPQAGTAALSEITQLCGERLPASCQNLLPVCRALRTSRGSKTSRPSVAANWMVSTRTKLRAEVAAARQCLPEQAAQRRSAAAEASSVHESSSTTRQPDSESATASHGFAWCPSAAEGASSEAAHPQPELLQGSRRHALADIQAQPGSSAVLHGRKQHHLGVAVAPESAATGSGSASGVLLGVRKGSKGHARQRLTAKLTGLIGRIVDVPADVFSVDVPDMYYRGLITKRDYGHKDSFEVKFLEDGTKYWLPSVDCQRWLDQMEARGRSETSQTVGAASDQFAASILAGFTGSNATRSCRHPHLAESTISGSQPRHSTGQGPPMTVMEPDLSNLQQLASAI